MVTARDRDGRDVTGKPSNIASVAVMEYERDLDIMYHSLLAIGVFTAVILIILLILLVSRKQKKMKREQKYEKDISVSQDHIKTDETV